MKKCNCENCKSCKSDYNDWLKSIECTGSTLTNKEGKKIHHVEITDKHKDESMDKVSELFDCIPSGSVLKIPEERIPPKIFAHVGNVDPHHTGLVFPKVTMGEEINLIPDEVKNMDFTDGRYSMSKAISEMKNEKLEKELYDEFSDKFINKIAGIFAIPIELLKNFTIMNESLTRGTSYFAEKINFITEKHPSFFENKYVSFTLSGRKRTGILIKRNSKSVFIQPVRFFYGYKKFRERPDGEIINRHIKKHNVVEFSYGIRPIN